jgi:myosin heavy subunit
VPANAKETELHFIRCIKPRPKPESNDDRKGLFVHSMTLQQITYMGVLESVNLKQKNFPFRKKFEEFYADYELLSPRYAHVRYYQMNKGSEDFESLAKDIMITQMQGKGVGRYCLGRTKILMMPDIRSVLEKCMDKASEMRNEKAKILKKTFSIFLGA